MRKIELGKTRENITVIGQGTWGIHRYQSPEYYESWKKALRTGIENGITMIDTAEFYGHGKSEQIVGEIIKEYNRDDLFVATKVFPLHYGYKNVIKACNRSLKKLDIKTIDLFQLHWPSPWGGYKGLFKALEELVKDGKIRYIGVSNFSVSLVIKSMELLKSNELASNQIKISVDHPKHIKKSWDFAKKEGITLIAYSPLGHSGLKGLSPEIENALKEVAEKRHISRHQVALAWLTSHDRIMAIPKAFNPSHVKQNAEVGDIVLSNDEMKIINKSVGLTSKVSNLSA